MNTREVSKTMGRACGRLLAILVFACLLAAVWMIAGTDETQAAEYNRQQRRNWKRLLKNW